MLIAFFVLFPLRSQVLISCYIGVPHQACLIYEATLKHADHWVQCQKHSQNEAVASTSRAAGGMHLVLMLMTQAIVPTTM